MKRLLILAALAVLVNGCVSFGGDHRGGVMSNDDSYIDRGTSGVSDGADPGPGVTGSEFAPKPWR